MKRQLVEKFRCVRCEHNELQLEVNTETEVGIVQGTLTCPLCSSRYKIENGVPLLHPASLSLRFEQGISSPSLERQIGEAHLSETDKLAEWLYYENNFSPKPHESQNLTYGLGWSCKPAVSRIDMYNFHLNRLFDNMDISLPDKEIISIGCGSGREVEWLSRMHMAIVTGLDIAPASVRAALERSINFHYMDRFEGVAGDMECLPFRDKSFDIALITTALHHAPDWRIAIKEMIRVAREGLVIDESADATVIRLAVSLGFSSDFEEDQSGNRVTRLKESTLARFLVELGTQEPNFRRYWLNTSRRFRWLTIGRIRLRPLMRIFESEALLRIQSILLDRIGNRLAVFAKL